MGIEGEPWVDRRACLQLLEDLRELESMTDAEIEHYCSVGRLR